jgi:hypothetical protein
MYPANGKMANVGIGGKTVSIIAAINTPAYKYCETSELTH